MLVNNFKCNLTEDEVEPVNFNLEEFKKRSMRHSEGPPITRLSVL